MIFTYKARPAGVRVYAGETRVDVWYQVIEARVWERPA